ncbi:hypothetical protein ACTFIU_001918 [Dictyostelium citrinum]
MANTNSNDNGNDHHTYEEEKDEDGEDDNLLNCIINGLVFDIDKLEKEIIELQETKASTTPTSTTPRSKSSSDLQQESQQQPNKSQTPNYKEELNNVTNSILQEFEQSKISSLATNNHNNNNSNNNKRIAVPDTHSNNPDKLLEIQLINKIFDINKAFDGKSNNLMSSFQNCTNNINTDNNNISNNVNNHNNNNSNNSNNNNNVPTLQPLSINRNLNNLVNGNSSNNNNGSNSNNVTIGSLRDLNKIQPQSLNEFGEWKSLIDEELSDLYTLVKELKRKIPSNTRTTSSNNITDSPVSKGRNKDLYLYNNTFTNILQLKNDLVSMIQSPMFKDNEYNKHHIGSDSYSGNNNNSNNNLSNLKDDVTSTTNTTGSPNKKSVKQLVLLFSP